MPVLFRQRPGIARHFSATADSARMATRFPRPGGAVGPADRKPFSVRHFRTRRFRMSLCRLARRAAMPASPHMRLVRAPRFARRAGMPVFGATRATAAAPPAAD
ncbi:hypothetical protein [Burkholderia pseudomallei]|uniref:hypothetical protein n=1 Tax=Burkholderia pseudomallei TaxID=28450 RepID=UPI001E2C4634|nr:hypothetical protein [Burkholderia pseudomallei]